MLYRSTRGAEGMMTSALAIKSGIAQDGGLYVPVHFPKFSQDELLSMQDLGYNALATKILALYLSDYNEFEITKMLARAYGPEKFGGTEPTPLKVINLDMGILELWHGPTCAFKDMALQLLPHLLTGAIQKTGENNKVVILVATSGDTGKAALEGFKDVAGTEVIVFYPSEGVSPTQRLQMVTQTGSNVKVFGIQGNFDDAQKAVKEIFTDAEFAKELKEKGFVLSSANSINWGRLLPQIVYYFSAYFDAVKQSAVKFGDSVNFVVPTGNFGDILAGYYAMKMGLPVNKLICASNSNAVLTDFLTTGTYNKVRDFVKTISPSMDILVSSNLERLLYDVVGLNGNQVARYMTSLQENGSYTVDRHELRLIRNNFVGYQVSEKETLDRIQLFYAVNNYLLDPHTAVAVEALNKYKNEYSKDKCFSIVLSTASPYKFSKDVAGAVDESFRGDSVAEYMQHLEDKTGVAAPIQLQGLEQRPVLHPDVIEVKDMREKIKDFLGRE